MTPPERWWVVTVRTPLGPAEELLPQTLTELGARGVVEEEEGTFQVQLEAPDDPDSALERLQEHLEGEVGPGLSLSWRWQPHQAWEELWRRGLQPRVVSPRLVVSPSWAPPPAEAGRHLLLVDPGMAFGTAEHPTTRGCLRLLDGVVQPGDRVLDVGAGSAILAVAAVLLGAESVLAVEVDPYAVEAARENLALNGVGGQVRVEERLVDRGWLEALEPVHGILANIESPILHPLLPGFRAALRPGGWLILSGILEEQAPALLAAAGTSGFRVEAEDREGDWFSALLRRPRQNLPATDLPPAPGTPA